MVNEGLENLIGSEDACLLTGLLYILHTPYEHLPRFEFIDSLVDHVVLSEYRHAKHRIVTVFFGEFSKWFQTVYQKWKSAKIWIIIETVIRTGQTCAKMIVMVGNESHKV